MQDSGLLVGFGQVDITPPVGLAMAGSLDPRWNVGVSDPLMAKAMVACSGARAIAVVGLDLVGLPRALADPIIAKAANRVEDIAPNAIMLSCSHTHSGPYLRQRTHISQKVTDPGYLARLPDLIADSVELAHAALRPATMHIGRSLVHHGLQHRRVLCKGPQVHAMMGGAARDLDTCPQVLGSAGPIDPEMWVVRFDDLGGHSFGALVNFSCHATGRFGTLYSADYPGVLAERLGDRFGPGFTTVFTNGACGNIKPNLQHDRWRESAEIFAQHAVAAANSAKRIDVPIAVDAERRDVAVPKRDPSTQPPDAISLSNMGARGGRHDVFDPLLQEVAKMPDRLLIPVNAARIGPFAIASNAGELFVEWGLSIKRRSPFPHTVVAELTNDTIGYQPTRLAFEQGGYETLVGANRVSLEGIETLIDVAVELLEDLWEREGRR